MPKTLHFRGTPRAGAPPSRRLGGRSDTNHTISRTSGHSDVDDVDDRPARAQWFAGMRAERADVAAMLAEEEDRHERIRRDWERILRRKRKPASRAAIEARIAQEQRKHEERVRTLRERPGLWQMNTDRERGGYGGYRRPRGGQGEHFFIDIIDREGTCVAEARTLADPVLAAAMYEAMVAVLDQYDPPVTTRATRGGLAIVE